MNEHTGINCPTCDGNGREMIDYGNGDVRDLPCSMCNGDGTFASFLKTENAIIDAIRANPHDGCMCLECAVRKGYDV